MEISLLGYIGGLLLLATPLYVLYVFDPRGLRRLLLSLATMIAATLLSAVALYAVIGCNHAAVTVLSGVAMSVVGAVLIIRKARLRMSALLLPVASGMVVSVFVVGLAVLLLPLELQNPFHPRFFIPIFALLTGCAIGANARALHIYYMGLHHHHRLYDYLLGNGSSHREATTYFARRAFRAALTPIMRHMSGLVVAHAPILMLALVMSGTSVACAAAMQILLFVMSVSVVVASLFATLIMARRYNFDEYERLRPIDKKAATADAAKKTQA